MKMTMTVTMDGHDDGGGGGGASHTQQPVILSDDDKEDTKHNLKHQHKEDTNKI